MCIEFQVPFKGNSKSAKGPRGAHAEEQRRVQSEKMRRHWSPPPGVKVDNYSFVWCCFISIFISKLFFSFFSNHVENARLISSNLLNESWFELLLLLYMIVNLIFNLFKFYYFCFIFISSLSFFFFFVSEMFKGLKMNMNFIIFRRWIKFVFFQLLEISEYVIVMLVFSWNLLKIISNISDLYFH